MDPWVRCVMIITLLNRVTGWITFKGNANISFSSDDPRYKTFFYDSKRHGALQTESVIGQTLNSVKVGSRIGVMLDAFRCLHLYTDGIDRGVFHMDMKQPCYAMIDFDLFLKKVYNGRRMNRCCTDMIVRMCSLYPDVFST